MTRTGPPAVRAEDPPGGRRVALQVSGPPSQQALPAHRVPAHCGTACGAALLALVHAANHSPPSVLGQRREACAALCAEGRAEQQGLLSLYW